MDPKMNEVGVPDVFFICFMFTRFKLGEDEFILTHIVFKWVQCTT